MNIQTENQEKTNTVATQLPQSETNNRNTITLRLVIQYDLSKPNHLEVLRCDPVARPIYAGTKEQIASLESTWPLDRWPFTKEIIANEAPTLMKNKNGLSVVQIGGEGLSYVR